MLYCTNNLTASAFTRGSGKKKSTVGGGAGRIWSDGPIWTRTGFEKANSRSMATSEVAPWRTRNTRADI